jgi:tRNA 2-(methylsulfanyl)-N6-isopentenyladenosine37 hydroxylase
MLRLKCDSSDAWVDVALSNIGPILIDHVHCERKAAAMAVSLITRYPHCGVMVDRMALLAQEEMEHFSRVLTLARDMGFELNRDKGDVYVNQLLKHVRKNEPLRMMDNLLCAAIIEARSCERFLRLSKALPEGPIQEMYADLIASEAGHYTLFLSLARMYFIPADVNARFDELLDLERDIVLALPADAKMHG